tara:strand:- start:306 stop:566 length:261 start_codon:yes stop_codon:yes gene_type:complete
MERRADEFSFEGAWAKQFKEEKENPIVKEQEEVKKHEAPEFRGQRDIVEKRVEFKMSSNKKTAPSKVTEALDTNSAQPEENGTTES